MPVLSVVSPNPDTTPRRNSKTETDPNSLKGIRDALESLKLDETPFDTFNDNMMDPHTPSPSTPGVKEVKLNPPKPFSGKRTELKRFLQDTQVYLTINKEVYDNDDKKIAFVLSFMKEGDAEAWKEEFVAHVFADSDGRGDDLSFGTFKAFRESLEKSFSPYDALGDALDEI